MIIPVGMVFYFVLMTHVFIRAYIPMPAGTVRDLETFTNILR